MTVSFGTVVTARDAVENLDVLRAALTGFHDKRLQGANKNSLFMERL